MIRTGIILLKSFCVTISKIGIFLFLSNKSTEKLIFGVKQNKHILDLISLDQNDHQTCKIASKGCQPSKPISKLLLIPNKGTLTEG